MRFTTIRVSFVGALLFSVIAVAQPRRMQLDDLGRVVRVSDPQIAPNGESILIVVSRANYDENRHDADLVLVDIASGNQRTLTQRAPERQPTKNFRPAATGWRFYPTSRLQSGQQPRRRRSSLCR